MSYAKDTQSRKWMLVINNPEEHGLTIEMIIELLNLFHPDYFCLAAEISSTGTYHIHIFLYSTSPIRFSTVKNRFPTAHIEVAKGSCLQNREYIRKEGKWEGTDKADTSVEGSFQEFGSMPSEAEEKSPKNSAVIQHVKDGLTNAEIIALDPSYAFRGRDIDQLRQDICYAPFRKILRNVEVHYLYGDSGTGKTRSIFDKHPMEDICRITNYAPRGVTQFDAYTGHPVLVFEEFHSQIPITAMLNYLDIYGVDENDVRMKQGEYIEQQAQEAARAQHISELFITKLEEWLYVGKYRKIKPNSFDRLENTLDFQIRPALDALAIQDIKINDVTTLHIDRIMDYNLNKGYSYSTLLKIRRFFVSFFDFYEDDIAKNPMKKYEFYTKDCVKDTQASLQEQKEAALAKIAQRKAEVKAEGSSKIYITEKESHIARMKLKSQEDESDIHYFNDEEIQRIKDAIQNGYRLPFKSRSGNDVMSARYFPKQGEFFLFMLYSGLRCGEATAMKYSDVDFENCTVNVCRNAVNVKERDANGKATGKRKRNLASVKTASSKQLLSVSPYAIEILRSLHAAEPAGYDGYIVHNGKHKALSSKSLWQRFDKLLKGAGVERCGLHSLRHTCATLLYEESDGDAKFVSEQLRHNDPGFTARTYIHQSPKRKKELLANFQI